MSTVTAADIQKVVDYAQSVSDAYMQKNFPTLPRVVIVAESGKRYIKLVKTEDNNSRSVYGFIDSTNGNLLKAAGWKAPALNKVRGNVLNDDLKCCGHYGIS